MLVTVGVSCLTETGVSVTYVFYRVLLRSTTTEGRDNNIAQGCAVLGLCVSACVVRACYSVIKVLREGEVNEISSLEVQIGSDEPSS